MIRLITPLREIFEDTRKSPLTVLHAGKCLCLLVKNESEIDHKIKLADEGGVVKVIKFYLEHYDFDEKLVLCCLDLFMYIMNEIKGKGIKELLYDDNQTGLMDVFIKFFGLPKVPGVYYSQRVR
jgi:hypothetical protein